MASKRRPVVRRPLVFASAVIVMAGAAIGIVKVAGSGSASPGQPAGTGSGSSSTFQVLRVTPTNGATGVGFASPITVTFSEPLASGGALPTLTPAIGGRWTRPSPDELAFDSSTSLPPATRIMLTVPGATAGVRALSGRSLSADFTATFRVASPTILRLQQLLAELDYLPVTFTPSGTVPTAGVASDAIDEEPTDPNAIPLDAGAGMFALRFSKLPTQLAATWQPGTWNLATKGAVMAFESDQGLRVDGEPGPALWGALLKAVADREISSKPYNYVLVTETYPETLYLWSNGQVVLQTPINSGVSGATTALGTFPVYLRYTSTTMTGINPDGSHYSDPGVPWVSYFNGSDAVHGFERPGYGYPQSNGCIEVPIETAEHVFPYDTYGTLVTITTGDLTSELGTPPPVVIAPPAAPPSSTTTTSTSTTTTTTTPARPRPRPTTTLPPVAPTTTAPTPATTAPPSSTTTPS